MSENTSTSEFGGSEPLGIDYYKSKLEEARERINQLESDQKQSMSRIMRMEVAGDNLVVCAMCDVSDTSQFVSAWRRSKK